MPKKKKPDLSMSEWMELQNPVDSDEEREEEEMRQERYNAPAAVEARRVAAIKQAALDKALRELKREEDARMARARERMKEAQAAVKVEETKMINRIYGQYAKAMREGDFETVYHMVDNVGITVNWEDSYGNTALICAAKYGLKVPIEELIHRGADVNHENQYGMTPLIEACKGGFGRVLNNLLFDPKKKTDMGTPEMRAEANARNKFGKTAADYANVHGHGKKCVPFLNDAIQRQLEDAKTLGFEIEEDDYKMAVAFNESDYTSKNVTRKRIKAQKSSRFTMLKKALGMENKDAIAKMHKLRDDAARKIQGFARYIKAQEEMSARFRQVVYEANRKRIKDLKKRLWIVKIQRGYRLKLARKRWALHRQRRLAATKINATVRMFVRRCYYRRRLETLWALRRMDEAVTLLQCCARRMKAQLVVSMKRRQRECALVIQRFAKLVSAKRLANVKRFERDREAVLLELRRGTRRIHYMLVFDELKEEVVAMHKIQVWARALLFNWSNRVDWDAIRRYRSIAATTLQCAGRSWLSWRRFQQLRFLRDKHLAGLPDVIQVRRLQASGKNAYRVGHKSKYGYCAKKGCECEKFRPPEPMKPLMCGCGHFITNHVIGYFRDPSQPDYYEPGLSRRKKQTRVFSAATGIHENFALVLKMKPKDLRKSLASTQAPPPPPRPPHRPHSAKAANMKYKKEMDDKKRRADARKNPYDPQRYAGAVVSSAEKKNPDAEARRKREAKQKVDKNMRMQKRLQEHRDFAEQMTGVRVSTAQANEIVSLGTTTGKPNASSSSLSGGVIWNLPGEEPAPARALALAPEISPTRKHTKSLIDQLESDIQATRQRVKKMRKNIIRLEREEKRARKDGRVHKKAYQQNATMLLIKNRLEVEPSETTHEKLINVHIRAVDKKKTELLDTLNAINAKAHGVASTESSTHGVRGSHHEEHSKSDADHAAPTTASSREQGLIDTKAAIVVVDRSRDEAIMSRVEDEAAVSGNAMMSTVSKSVLHKKRLMRKRIRNRKKGGRNQPFEDQPFGGMGGVEEIGPTSDMVMNALKGMMKSIAKGPERTKNRWQRTPETSTRPKRKSMVQEIHGSHKQNFTEEKHDPRLLAQEASRELHHLDWRCDEQDAYALAFNESAEDAFDERGIFLNQRAETPLVHVAWRQSHQQRAPVVELQLLGGPAKSSKSGMLPSFPDKIELKSGRTMVGRDGKVCDIMMDSARQPKMISKVHACFWVTKKGAKWLVEVSDCHSTNGTFVNGKRVSARQGRKRVNVGSTVMFGRRSRKEKKRSELLYLLTENRTSPTQQAQMSTSDLVNMEREVAEVYPSAAMNNFPPKQKERQITPLKKRHSHVARHLNIGSRYSSETTNTMEILSPDRQSMPIPRHARSSYGS
jgi:pSer/pThr/pTyr-binding forkhead associated (FHA) protein